MGTLENYLYQVLGTQVTEYYSLMQLCAFAISGVGSGATAISNSATAMRIFSRTTSIAK